MSSARIQSPDDEALSELCLQLAELTPELDRSNDWPARQLELCGDFGVYEWFIPRLWGGQEWSELDIARGYLRLSAACLTTTFILTQRVAACRRIVVSQNDVLKRKYLFDLAAGTHFSTVGISHLTTSRRHLKTPVLQAEETATGFVLNGFSPWVTGALHADSIVVGAITTDGQQLLVLLPTSSPGVVIPPPIPLVGLSASHTGEVRCERVEVPRELVLAGPVENVMAESGTRTGGLQTSTLAIGLASAAIEFLTAQTIHRAELKDAAEALSHEQQELVSNLLSLASGEESCSPEDLRAKANSLVLRSSQAALAAAKGSGYVLGHPAGRWCREALFFLVWSCPQPVVNSNLCELAGLSD